MSRLVSGAGLLAAALILAACAASPLSGPAPTASVAVDPPQAAPAAPEPSPPPIPGFATLAGWADDDHRAALEAFRVGCGVSKDAALVQVCRRARALGSADAVTARGFLEANFRLAQAGDTGLLTAYFAPQYEARAARSAEFSAPLRPKPDDLATLSLGAFDSGLAGRTIVGRVRDGAFEPYPTRAQIDARVTTDALAWMRPEDLFFLQIQGSGVLVFEGGVRKRAAFAAHNGRPFVGVAAPMRDRGLLADNNTSGDAIRTWLAGHRGPEADAVMQLNPRYVFFTLSADDGREAVGAAGVPLPAGRAIAVDPAHHAYGGLYWLDAQAPALSGAFPTYRRTVVALDTGGAIKGEARADLYLGSGDAAGSEAGRVRHGLTLYRLVPIS